MNQSLANVSASNVTTRAPLPDYNEMNRSVGITRGSQSLWQLWSRDVTVATASVLQYGRHRENGRFSDREIRAN